MKMTAVVVSMAALLACLSGCGGGKYADAEKVINRQYEMMDAFTIEVDKAEEAAQVIAALKKFQKTAEGAREEMMQLTKKYPELMTKENAPEELQEVVKKMDEMMPRFINAMMKIGQQYGDNPEVKKVLADMQSSLAPPRK
ncbi:MAG: hypothetical protein V1789_04615 [PVC group bacterium]